MVIVVMSKTIGSLEHEKNKSQVFLQASGNPGDGNPGTDGTFT
jgi:hypothetical protein